MKKVDEPSRLIKEYLDYKKESELKLSCMMQKIERLAPIGIGIVYCGNESVRCRIKIEHRPGDGDYKEFQFHFSHPTGLYTLPIYKWDKIVRKKITYYSEQEDLWNGKISIP